MRGHSRVYITQTSSCMRARDLHMRLHLSISCRSHPPTGDDGPRGPYVPAPGVAITWPWRGTHEEGDRLHRDELDDSCVVLRARMLFRGAALCACAPPSPRCQRNWLVLGRRKTTRHIDGRAPAHPAHAGLLPWSTSCSSSMSRDDRPADRRDVRGRHVACKRTPRHHMGSACPP